MAAGWAETAAAAKETAATVPPQVQRSSRQRIQSRRRPRGLRQSPPCKSFLVARQRCQKGRRQARRFRVRWWARARARAGARAQARARARARAGARAQARARARDRDRAQAGTRARALALALA